MDLRQKKTRQNIFNAFLQLRAHKDLERITVKELCRIAQISKATFYLHYRDIYHLSETICREVIADLLSHISCPENLWLDPARFVQEITLSLHGQKHMFDILFSGSQRYLLPQTLEACIRDMVFLLRPQLREDARFGILLSYQIRGSYYAYSENAERFGFDCVLRCLGEISDTLGQYFWSQEAGECPENLRKNFSKKNIKFC